MSVTFDRSAVEQARRQGHAPRPLQVLIDHLDQFDALAGEPGNPIAALQQQPGDARPDRAEPDNGNFGDIHIHTLSAFWQTPNPSREPVSRASPRPPSSDLRNAGDVRY